MRRRLFQVPTFLAALCAAGAALAALTAVSAVQPAPAPAPRAVEPACCGADVPVRADAPKAYPRGHKLPAAEDSARRHRVSNARYGAHLRGLPVATQAAYDAYTATGGSCVPPIGDQGPCGDCYLWSAMKVCSAAQMTAGVVPKGTGFMLSVQWGLDCHPELGGCDGGDEYQVAQLVQSGGAPALAQYAGAGQRPGRCQSTANMSLYTVSSLAYVDPVQTDQGVASTQSIKNAILAYGYVSVAVAAGSDWDNYQGGTLTGRNRQVNHAVGATGWDDNHDNGDGTKGAFILDNQWSESWGNKGRAWIKYGADQFGTEAFVAIVNAPPTPPTPPTPIPPGPGPGPGPGPIPPGVTTITISQPLYAGTYKIVPAGAVVIDGNMTLNEILKALADARPAAPLKP